MELFFISKLRLHVTRDEEQESIIKKFIFDVKSSVESLELLLTLPISSLAKEKRHTAIIQVQEEII